MTDRRHFLKAGGISAGGLLLSPFVHSQSGNPIQRWPLAEDLYLLRGSGENIVASATDNGILLVDGGIGAEGRALSDMLRQTFSTRQVNTLINTHWHPEQTGVNLALGSRGTEIIAHENTRLWLSTEIIVRWQDTIYPPQPTEALPHTTFHEQWQRRIQGENVECGHLMQGHTDGDIYVFFRDRNVLVAGGVLNTDSWPVIDWSTAGWIGGMARALRTLVEMADDDTIIVPASGSAISKAELETLETMFSDIFTQLRMLLEQGEEMSAVLAANPAQGYKPEWGSPELFLTLAYKSFWGHIRQFEGAQA